MSADIMRDMEAAVACHRSGDLISAAGLYQGVLKRFPDQPDALHFLGVIAGEMGEIEKAVKLIDRSLQLDPRNAVFFNNYGNVLRQAGAPMDATAAYRRAVRFAPDYAVAHNNLGIALSRCGEPEKAEKSFRRAIKIEPAYFDAHNNLGTCLYIQRRIKESESAFRDAVAADPGQPSGYNNLANALAMLGRTDEAEATCRKALAKDPDHASTHVVFGGLLEAGGRFTEAEDAYRTALRLHDESPEAWNNLGNLLRAEARHTEAIEAFRTALELQPANAMAHSNLLFSIAFEPHMTGEILLAEAKSWNQRHAAETKDNAKARAIPHPNQPDKARRLRVGYVSPDFREHAVGSFLAPLFDAHDRDQVEIFAYADVARPDRQTSWFEQRADNWRNTFGWADPRLVRQIRDDRIDVLIDVAGHTGGNRLLSFADRPAPVQASWLGYGGSTGVDAMGWRITDGRTDPDFSASHYCEKLIRLPHSLFCYKPESEAPPVGPLPLDSADHITFGSFNNLSKIHDRAVSNWARAMSQVSGSRLVIKGRGLDDAGLRTRFLDRFAASGIAADRLDLIGYQQDKASHLSAISSVDLVLDTFPYSGATTTCEALWMGVPVVTIGGDRYVARMAAGLLGCVGLDELVAEDEDDYVNRVVALAADPDRLRHFRRALRDRVASSPLCDAGGFAAAMEQALRTMWCCWVDERTHHV
jgi:predicted O-linked N-acetylglucosamine transferase (SPINDLY family)